MLRTSDLEYDLPEGAIATAPAEPRDSFAELRNPSATFLSASRVPDLDIQRRRFFPADGLLSKPRTDPIFW